METPAERTKDHQFRVSAYAYTLTCADACAVTARPHAHMLTRARTAGQGVATCLMDSIEFVYCVVPPGHDCFAPIAQPKA